MTRHALAPASGAAASKPQANPVAALGGRLVSGALLIPFLRHQERRRWDDIHPNRYGEGRAVQAVDRATPPTDPEVCEPEPASPAMVRVLNHPSPIVAP